jgi:hypothetical protein
METWQVAVVSALVAAVIAAVVTWAIVRPQSITSTTSRDSMICGFSVWCYQNGKWTMIEDSSTPGHVADSQFTRSPGPHEGYCVRVISRPIPRS